MMNCINCYQEIPDGTNFCPYCGARQSGYPAPADGFQGGRGPGSISPESAAPADGFQDNPIPVNTPQENSQEDISGRKEENGQTEPVCTGTEEQTGEEMISDAFQTEGQDFQTPDSSAPAGDPEETSDPRQTQETSETWNDQQDNPQPYSSAGTGGAAGPSGMPGQEGQPYQAPPVYQQPYQSGIQEKPVNWVPYLILSIISTLCCCLPLGIAGIVYSAKINSMTTAGRTEEAKQAARTATIWIIIAFVVGVILDICAFLLVLTAAVTDSYYGGIFDVIRHLAH